MLNTPRTLYDKLWDDHVVAHIDGRTALIYIDRHLIQEVSSPQAFAKLKASGGSVHHRNSHLAVADHAVPTLRETPLEADPLASEQVATLERNTAFYKIPYIPVNDKRQGIVHVIGPELGFTLPGASLVCGDSHTSTHGAFGALAFGIGTTETRVVLQTQCLVQSKALTMRVSLSGRLPVCVSMKDVALALIRKIGTDGAKGYAIQFCGEAVANASMEARMTLCNMATETGARIGLIEPDQTTFNYLEGRHYAPKGDLWHKAVAYWKTLISDPGVIFDREIDLNLANLAPQITWGTRPDQTMAVDEKIPDKDPCHSPMEQQGFASALDYMGLASGTAPSDIVFDTVFIGSCTNARIEDLRAAAVVVEGRTVSHSIKAMVVPGSGQVKAQAEAEGLDLIFKAAGFSWRDPGCSLCVAMNADRLNPGQRCASTSNRNFEGRQGPGSRTHLMSPAMAAGVAIWGRITDIRAIGAAQ